MSKTVDPELRDAARVSKAWPYEEARKLLKRYPDGKAGNAPILFETAGSDLQCAKIDLPWMEGRIRPAITWQWAEGAVPYMAGRMRSENPASTSTKCWLPWFLLARTSLTSTPDSATR